MTRYETLYLTVPEITADEATAIERQLEKLVKEHNATLLSFERWGKFKLAYPVRKNDYGVYFLARFEITPENAGKFLEDLNNLLSVKHNDLVMRFMTTVLDKKKPLTYQRPESLEETPSRDRELGGLFKEKSGHYNRSTQYSEQSE